MKQEWIVIAYNFISVQQQALSAVLHRIQQVEI